MKVSPLEECLFGFIMYWWIVEFIVIDLLWLSKGTKGMLYGRESLTLALHALYLHYTANLVLR